MTISVFPSLMPGEPIEKHEWAGTIGAWLESNGIDYLAQEAQPVVVFVNGDEISCDQWATTRATRADQVDIKVLPRGLGAMFIAAVVAIVALVAVIVLMPKPGVNGGRNSTGRGQKLETADGEANQVKFGDVVPELAGRFRRYPDYLTPPRRYFASPREQWLEFLCCVGPGEYEIKPENVRISDSEFASLGPNASYGVHGPGADLSGVAAHEHWHTANEVGGTASGTVGLELSVNMGQRHHDKADSYEFEGSTVTIPSGQGEFPQGWGEGTVVDITLPLPYAVTVEPHFTGGANINRFIGDFQHIKSAAQVAFSGGTYSIYASDLDASGYGWIELYTPLVPYYPGSDGDPSADPPIPPSDPTPEVPAKPYASLSTGDYTLAFSVPGTSYSVTTASPNLIAVSRAGFAGFPSVTSSSATVVFVSGQVYGEWTSMFAACPPAERTSVIELDFFFPSGLAHIQDNGDLGGRSVSTEIQYRDANTGGSYTSVIKSYSNNTLDQIGYTHQIAVPNIRPEVRVRRIGATSTDTQIQDTVHWYGMKSKLSTRTSYPKWTTMSVRIRSGGRLAAQSENKINVIATRILPILQADGSWSAPQPTRDITAICKYIATSIGYTDDDLEMAEFMRLNGVWQGRGETFDYVFDETTVKEAFNTALGAGMAELTVDDGKIKPSREGVRTQYEHSYSPQNMTGPLRRSFKAPKHDDADGVEVEYIDGTTWAKDVVRCFLPEDQGFKIAKIKVDGVLSRTTAWRIGMRHRRALRYRNWEYSFSTELDALNSGYMSYVPLFDDLPGYGKSAILERIEAHADGALLHVSEPMVWEAGAEHVVAYRRPDGTLAGPFAAQPGTNEYQIIAAIPQPWPTVTLKMEPPHVYFGTTQRWSFPALITDIKPQGLESVSVTATNYSEKVYADDDNFPPI